MDKLDKLILCELDENCRSSAAQIAKRLRTNRNVVAYRIGRLEQAGIIQHYICSINLGVLGYKTYKVYIKVRTGATDALEKYLLDNTAVIHCLKLEGLYDYSLAVATKTILELDAFLSGIKNRFHDLVKDYTVSLLVYSKIFKLQKLLEKHSKELKIERYSGEDVPVDIDEKDKRMLRVLAQEANLPMVELAKRTNLSIDIVKYRLKNLSKLVLSYRVMLNLEQLGYYHYVLLLRTRQATLADERRLLAWCMMKPNVLYVSKRIGAFDFEVNVAITGINDLNDLLAEVKKEFGAMIDSYDVILNAKLLKLNYVPF